MEYLFRRGLSGYGETCLSKRRILTIREGREKWLKIQLAKSFNLSELGTMSMSTYQHVFRKPSFISSNDTGNAESKALLAKE